MLAQSSWKNFLSDISKLWQVLNLKFQSIYRTEIVPAKKWLRRSERWFRKMAVFMSILTLGAMIPTAFSTLSGFSLLPALVGIFFLTISVWLSAALAVIQEMRENNSNT